MKTQHSYKASTLGPSKTLMIRNESHSISKETMMKPKIRIIHIVAPEIIKTDVENFRELVQRLTGKKSSRSIIKKEIKNVSSLTHGKKKPQAKGDNNNNNNPNTYLSFLGDHGDVEGFMHGINDFPLLPFRSNSQVNTFAHHMPL